MSDRFAFLPQVVSSLVAQCLRYLCHAVLIGWLIYHAPKARLSREQVDAASDATLFNGLIPVGWLVLFIHYIPNWILTSAWIALCEAAAMYTVSFVQHTLFSRGG